MIRLYTERAEQNFCKTHINYIKNIALTGFTLALAIFSAEPSLARDNRTDVRAEISEGWTVAWGKHIDHWEYGKLSACMFDPTLVCVQSYFTNLLESSVQDIGKEVVLRALKNRGETFGAGRFEIQAGIATYNHWHMENPCSLNPFNGDCWQKFPEPNTHQPYLRWRRVRSSNASIVPNVALIKSPINDRVLDFRNSDRNREPIKLVDEHRGRSQQWRLVPLNNGFYLIKSVVNGRVLDFRNSDRNGEPVKLVNEHRGDSQQWKLEQLSNGRFIIVSKVNGRVLDFRNSDRNREPVKLVNRHGGASQQWILEGL